MFSFTKQTTPTTVQLTDNTLVFCLSALEAKVLEQHINGYLQEGIQLRDKAIVFDVGANIGLMGVRILQQYPNAQVFAFEPIPAIFNVLQHNARPFNCVDKKRFIALPFGIAATHGQTVFKYYPNAPASSTANPELWNQKSWQQAVEDNIQDAVPTFLKWIKYLPKFIHGWIAKWLHANPQTVHCELRTLSEMIARYQVPHIDLLKIDCEGHEWSVLLGIQATDWPKIRQMVVEVHDIDGRLEKVIKLLTQQGFANITTAQEVALANTNLINVYATRKHHCTDT